MLHEIFILSLFPVFFCLISFSCLGQCGLDEDTEWDLRDRLREFIINVVFLFIDPRVTQFIRCSSFLNLVYSPFIIQITTTLNSTTLAHTLAARIPSASTPTAETESISTNSPTSTPTRMPAIITTTTTFSTLLLLLPPHSSLPPPLLLLIFSLTALILL